MTRSTPRNPAPSLVALPTPPSQPTQEHQGPAADDFNTDDIAAMRRKGVLPAFLRSRIIRPDRPHCAVLPGRRTAAGHRPGAWPSATAPRRRPAPLLCCDCVLCQALAQHKETGWCPCARCKQRRCGPTDAPGR